MTISVAPAGMLLFVFTMVYAGLTDLTTMKISNSLVLLFLVAYMVLAPLAGFTVREMAWSAAVATGVLAIAFIFFALGWIGGGDAKLAAVTALWFGTDHTAAYLVYAALLGGAFTAGLLIFKMHALPAWLQNGSIARLHSLHSRQAGIPYGVALALAGLIVFPGTRWMTTLF
jgi:prepilin peptidase CpaA